MKVQQIIEQKINEQLTPLYIEVRNESHMHSVPADSESHFKVTVVSEQFKGKPLLARHRLINEALADELAGSVHALAIHTMTPDEWAEKGGTVPDSPPCHGGSKAKVS